MPDYTKSIEEAWKKLVKYWDRGEFKPRNEVEVQAYLYSILRKVFDPDRVRLEPSIHAKKPDIVLMTKEGDPGVVAEIKWRSPKPHIKKKSWMRDCKKLEKYGNETHRVYNFFLVFIAERTGQKGNPPASLKKDMKNFKKGLTENQRYIKFRTNIKL